MATGRVLAQILSLFLVVSALNDFSAEAFTGTYGINYGRLADNIPSPDKVVKLLKASKIKNVRIFDSDHSVLEAFRLIQTPLSTKNTMSSPKIPTEQWAQVIEKVGGPVEYKKIPVGKPGPEEVLVNIKYSGVCHTDLHAVNGDWPIPTKLPLVGGHEGAGIVVARGELVTDDICKIGEAVGVKWLNDSCLSCTFCQQADEPLCLTPKLSGYTVDGSFQQYALASARHVAHIPEGVPLDEISPVLCAGITVYKGLKESGARPGQTVAIVGAGGGLGSLAQQYAKAMGLHVIGIDSGEEKRALCAKMGAETFIDFAKSSDVIKDVKAATKDGLGPHAVILVAVSEKPFQQAAEYVRPRGTVIVIGLPAKAYIRAPVFESVLKMVRIQCSYVGNRQDSEEALDFFARGLIKVPFKTVDLKDLPKVYDLMHAGQIAGRYVLKMPDTE